MLEFCKISAVMQSLSDFFLFESLQIWQCHRMEPVFQNGTEKAPLFCQACPLFPLNWQTFQPPILVCVPTPLKRIRLPSEPP